MDEATGSGPCRERLPTPPLVAHGEPPGAGWFERLQRVVLSWARLAYPVDEWRCGTWDDPVDVDVGGEPPPSLHATCRAHLRADLAHLGRRRGRVTLSRAELESLVLARADQLFPPGEWEGTWD